MTTLHNKEKKTVYFFLNHFHWGEWKQHVFGCDSDITFIDLMNKINMVTVIIGDISSSIRYSTYARGNDKYNNNVVVNDDESLELAIEFVGEDAYDKNKGIVVFGHN